MTPYFFLKINGSHSITPYFFFRSVTQSQYFFKISTTNWLFQMILCTIILLKFEIQYWVLIWPIMGLATRERGSRSMQINVDSLDPDYVYTVNCTSRSASVLGLAFVDPTLTQCDFYARRCSRAFVMCAYVHVHANCCFQILRCLRSVENFM